VKRLASLPKEERRQALKAHNTETPNG
jgi:hypothetical protein